MGTSNGGGLGSNLLGVKVGIGNGIEGNAELAGHAGAGIDSDTDPDGLRKRKKGRK